MWSLAKIILLIAFFTLPGWAFLLIVALVFYFGFFKSIQTKQKNGGAFPLPTWFREENFSHIQNKSGKKYQKAAEIFLRTSAELQSRKNKKRQRLVRADGTIDPNLEFARPTLTNKSTQDFDAHKTHTEHKNTDNYGDAHYNTQQKTLSSYHCRQCNLTFTGTTKQVCHLSDCPFSS